MKRSWKGRKLTTGINMTEGSLEPVIIRAFVLAMKWSVILISAILITKILGNNLMDLAMDFTVVDNPGRIRVCNFITCWGTDNFHLVKEASSSFRCSVAVKSPEESIAEWYSPTSFQLFVVDLDCPGTVQLLKKAESLGLFNDHQLWLVTNSNEVFLNGTSAWDVFQDIYATAISQVYIAKQVSDDRFEIIGVYKRNPNERLIQERLGYWTKDEGVVFTGVKLPSSRRENTEGRVFKAAGVVTDDDSLNHLHDLVNPDTDNPTKIYYNFWENMVTVMNGRLEFIVARKWGEYVNGSFNGMMGYIQRKEAEIPISPMYISEARLQFVRYLAIGHSFRIKMLFLSPPLSYKNNIYLLPFSTEVWYTCALLFALCIILLYIVADHEDGTNDLDDKTRCRPLPKSWIEIIMLNVGTICQQDVYMEPKGVCGRIIILHVKILVLFVTVFYSASILVLLQSSDHSITTLKDMDESNFKVAAHDTPYNRFYLKVLKDPAGKAIVNKMPNKTGFMTAEEGIKKVQHGFFAFHVNRGTGYLVVRQLFNERDKCRLQELDESLLPNTDPMMAVRRDLPYREIVSVTFQKLYERGLINREGHRKSAGRPPCGHSPATYVNIGVIECKGAFEVLLAGIFFSSVIFLAELYVYKRKEKKMKSSVLQYGYYE